MKIVNLKTFLSLPEGTVFSKYEPCVFDSICVKRDSLLDINDFLFDDIGLAAIENDSSEDFSDKLFDSQHNNRSLKMDFYYTGRDGCFDKNQLFAVLESDDIKELIKKLKFCLNAVVLSR